MSKQYRKSNQLNQFLTRKTVASSKRGPQTADEFIERMSFPICNTMPPKYKVLATDTDSMQLEPTWKNPVIAGATKTIRRYMKSPINSFAGAYQQVVNIVVTLLREGNRCL